jgi:hypothetical protein
MTDLRCLQHKEAVGRDGVLPKQQLDEESVVGERDLEVRCLKYPAPFRHADHR